MIMKRFKVWRIIYPSVQSLSHIQLCDPMGYGTPGFPVHHQLPELAQIHVHQVGDAIQSSHPLSPLSPAFNLSQHQGFLFLFSPISQFFASGGHSIGASTSESVLPMSIHGWFPLGLTGLRAVQGALRSLQHHSSKASILWCSAFFMVQLSHPYILLEKTIALTIWTFVGKVMSLLFNMLSRFVTAFLSRTKSF